MPGDTDPLFKCGSISDLSLMIGLNIIANGGHQSYTSYRVSFLRNWNVVLLYRPVNRLHIFYLQPEDGKHCQPSSTSFGLVDRFKGNYSATGRGNSFSGRGKSISAFHCLRTRSHQMTDSTLLF